MEKKTLVDLLDRWENLDRWEKQDVLDELIHEDFSAQAASVNNEGPEGQIDYLLSRGWTVQQIADKLGYAA